MSIPRQADLRRVFIIISIVIIIKNVNKVEESVASRSQEKQGPVPIINNKKNQ